jgi:hypothetical protein
LSFTPRTDLNSWIELATDGERLWVEVEREPELEDWNGLFASNNDI